jgi:hypothetical protein
MSFLKGMDCRVKPGNDDVALFRSSPAMTMWRFSGRARQ